MFLSLLQETTPQIRANPLAGVNEFALGFVNGTQILNAIPSFATCDPLNEKLVNSINLFVATLGNLTYENYQETFTALVAIGHDIYDQANISLATCPSAARETKTLVVKLGSHIAKDGYIAKIFSHATTNIADIIARVSIIQRYITTGKHFDAGVDSGSMFNFLFFHDFAL